MSGTGQNPALRTLPRRDAGGLSTTLPILPGGKASGCKPGKKYPRMHKMQFARENTQFALKSPPLCSKGVSLC